MAAPMKMFNQEDFIDALSFAQENLGVSVRLKDRQVEALTAAYKGRDCVAVLPTGYGKSLIFQLLPWVIQRGRTGTADKPVITIVVSPLNSIMQDQVVRLAERGVKACYLDIAGSSATTYELIPGRTHAKTDSDEGDTGSVDEDEQTAVYSEKNVSVSDLRSGNYILIYAHPEALTSNNLMGVILRSRVFQERVGCIAVDEVHMVAEWGEEFRPAFTKLGDLNALFDDAVHLAVTATVTPTSLGKLTDVLQFKDPVFVQLNPDRPNIYIELKTRLPNIHKLDKYDDLIHPLFVELKEKKSNFPVTIVYVDSLDALGYCYQYLEQHLDGDGYISGHTQTPEHRIFAMFHKDYTEKMKSLIIKELRKDSPIIRLVLATIALGMGLDAPAVIRIIHFRPPTNLEKYMQEIGRAGRKGQTATATMFYNNSDIASNRPGLSQDIVDFCRNGTTCLRKQLLKYFGFERLLYSGSPDQCCSNCRKVN